MTHNDVGFEEIFKVKMSFLEVFMKNITENQKNVIKEYSRKLYEIADQQLKDSYKDGGLISKESLFKKELEFLHIINGPYFNENPVNHIIKKYITMAWIDSLDMVLKLCRMHKSLTDELKESLIEISKFSENVNFKDKSYGDSKLLEFQSESFKLVIDLKNLMAIRKCVYELFPVTESQAKITNIYFNEALDYISEITENNHSDSKIAAKFILKRKNDFLHTLRGPYFVENPIHPIFLKYIEIISADLAEISIKLIDFEINLKNYINELEA